MDIVALALALFIWMILLIMAFETRGWIWPFLSFVEMLLIYWQVIVKDKTIVYGSTTVIPDVTIQWGFFFLILIPFILTYGLKQRANSS